MKALKIAAVTIALAFASIPASAAVILSQNTSTGLVCAFELRCVASAQIDFRFPTEDYTHPLFAAGPTTEVFVPPRYTYRLVITAPEAPIATVAHTFYNYHEHDYVFFDGTFRPAGGWDQSHTDFRLCDLDGGCTPGGYVQNNQSIFTFEDGLMVYPGTLQPGYPYNNGYRINILALWTEGASVAAFFDPALAGMPVTIEVFQFSAVPEPSIWVMLILGFGLTGAMLRRRRVSAAPAT